jgi:hypothetical protein
MTKVITVVVEYSTKEQFNEAIQDISEKLKEVEHKDCSSKIFDRENHLFKYQVTLETEPEQDCEIINGQVCLTIKSKM